MLRWLPRPNAPRDSYVFTSFAFRLVCHARGVRDFGDSPLRIRLGFSSIIVLEKIDQRIFPTMSSRRRTYGSITVALRTWLCFEVRLFVPEWAFHLVFQTVSLAWPAVALASAFFGAMMLGCGLG